MAIDAIRKAIRASVVSGAMSWTSGTFCVLSGTTDVHLASILREAQWKLHGDNELFQEIFDAVRKNT